MTGIVLTACSDKETAEEPAGRVLHVSVDGNDETGDGSAEHPFATPAYAAAQAEPGTEVIVHGGRSGKAAADPEKGGCAGRIQITQRGQGIILRSG